jgi:hypothetical protein
MRHMQHADGVEGVCDACIKAATHSSTHKTLLHTMRLLLATQHDTVDGAVQTVSGPRPLGYTPVAMLPLHMQHEHLSSPRCECLARRIKDVYFDVGRIQDSACYRRDKLLCMQNLT